MSNHETSGQEPDGCTDLEVTVCDNGVVNVRRPESERAHSVMVGVLGDVVHCSCKGYKFRGECAHADAIERRPLVVSSALATAAADTQRVATDGGQPTVECHRCEYEWEYTGDKSTATCPNCTYKTTIATDGGRDVPTTTDFRGEERRATCRECGDRLLQGSIDIGEDVCIPCSARDTEAGQ